jgi:hypothetical protein
MAQLELRFKGDRAYLQIQPIVNAIMMDVFLLPHLRLLHFSPEHHLLLHYYILYHSRQILDDAPRVEPSSDLFHQCRTHTCT